MLGLKERFWFKVKRDIIHHPEGKVLSLPLKLLYTILFPLKRLHYSVANKEGYQWESDSWIIHGILYPDEIFYEKSGKR